MMGRLFTLFLYIIVTTTSLAASDSQERVLYRSLSKVESKRLLNIADSCQRNDSADLHKALTCYTIVVNRYEDNMRRDDKLLCAIASNRAGYMYFYRYYEYATAYRMFSRAVDICEEIGEKEELLNAYQCLANIYMTSAEHTDNPHTIKLGLQLFRKSFNLSLEQKNYNGLISNFTNMTAVAFSIDSIHLVDEELKTFSSVTIPRDVPLGQFAHWLYEAMAAVSQEQYEKAIDCMNKQLEAAEQASAQSKERLVSSVYFNMSILYAHMGDYNKAITALKKVEQISHSVGTVDMLANSYHYLADYYKHTDQALANKYRYQYLNLKDTLERANRLQDVAELYFLDELQKIDSEMQQMHHDRKINRIFDISLVINFVILAFFLYILYRKNRTLRTTNRELYNKNVALLRQEDQQKHSAKYETSNLNDGDKQQLLQKIMQVFDEPETICSPTFSLDFLASRIESKSKYVSQVINEAFSQSFTNVLTEARIKEACKRLSDVANYGNYTIEAIANSVGFKSRANFVTNFKKFTGLTPSAYQRIAKGEE